ncbi:g2384 [Coccomyxa viridis]|uniref:G2384 protein n=1 Tax=Coccomyxa viridis TaxID=1274662 RepID=A0ABP1FMJ2_9CHLO
MNEISECPKDPLAEGFDPTTPAPPELSSWLYLFHAYLQMEEVYAETLEWLDFVDHRLIDPYPPFRGFTMEAEECWSAFTACYTKRHMRPGSRASWHKRY